MAIDKDQILSMVDKVPAFPQSVHKILELTSSADCSPKELIQIIEHDPILTAKVLKLVNSAYFGLSRKVTSVNHAVVYIGINTIKNVAISVATSGVLPKENKAGLDMDAFWLHSLTVGVIARMLAKKISIPKNEQANYFVAGLLHDIGKVILAHFKPKDYAPVLHEVNTSNRLLFDVENELLGIDHAQLGGILAKKWQLPENLIDSISNHHAIQSVKSPSDLEIAIAASNSLADYHILYQSTDDEITRAAIPKPALSEIETQWMQMNTNEALAYLTNLEDDINKAKAFIH